jgi:hypothetical protein
MQNYIIESMAQVGCGISDTKEIAQIVESLTDIEHDTLDAMHNFGQHTTLTPVGSMTRANLISRYSDDDLICLSTYVNAYRNCN